MTMDDRDGAEWPVRRGGVTAWTGLLVICVTAGWGSVGTVSRAAVRPTQILSAEQQLLSDAGLVVGQPLPDFVAFDQQGAKVHLRARDKAYRVYVAGCNTCQPFLNKVDTLERVADEFAGRDVRFYYLHKGVVHPEQRHLLEPYTLRERLMLIEQYQTELQSTIPWLVDGAEGSIQKRLGIAFPNIELVVAPDGTLVHASQWSQPAELRRVLQKLVPPRDGRETPAAESRPARQFQADQRPADKGPDSTFKKPLYMPRLVVIPEIPDLEADYFLKLRAEVERPVLKGKPGQLYLRFDLDPLYKANWGESSAPPRIALQTSGERPRILVERTLELPNTTEPAFGPQPLELLLEAPLGRKSVVVEIHHTVRRADHSNVENHQRFEVQFVEFNP